MTPSTFAEALRTLTDSQLDKVGKILEHLDSCKTTVDFDELLEKIKSPNPPISQSDAALIGARTYQLEVCEGVDHARASAQALEEFGQGKLHHAVCGEGNICRQIERRRLRAERLPERTPAIPTQSAPALTQPA